LHLEKSFVTAGRESKLFLWDPERLVAEAPRKAVAEIQKPATTAPKVGNSSNHREFLVVFRPTRRGTTANLIKKGRPAGRMPRDATSKETGRRRGYKIGT